MSSYRILVGDCRRHMAEMDEASVDAVVCDPPYGLAFMGKGWDHAVPGVEFWTAALRVAKPGAHLLAFGGTRTFHRLACAIEDAGWEIRDTLSWLYGSGFPKSLDVSKAIDKAAGEVRGYNPDRRNGPNTKPGTKGDKYSGGYHNAPEIDRGPATPEAERWQGWGTALKPAWEPIILARKPLAGTVAANVQEHGTGALNVDGCRTGTEGESFNVPQSDPGKRAGTVGTDLGISRADRDRFQEAQRASIERTASLGRWPANVLLDEEAAMMLDEQSGIQRDGVAREPEAGTPRPHAVYSDSKYNGRTIGYGGSGGASRFFYTAKASRSERGEDNHHPTVKPVDLMRWLIRLVTPPQGVVLDPFMGSGTTGVACTLEGFDFVGVELNEEYAQIARRRLVNTQPSLFGQPEEAA